MISPQFRIVEMIVWRGDCFVPVHPADDGSVGPETCGSFVN